MKNRGLDGIYPKVEDIVEYGKTILGKRLGDIDVGNILKKKNKGGVGNCIERYFGIEPNSRAEADFATLGVEIKASPFRIVRKTKYMRMKERVVCNIIPYETENLETFGQSSFWKKNRNILLFLYKYEKGKKKEDYIIEKMLLLQFGETGDIFTQMQKDWETITNKIKEGKAHLLSEGDTVFLGAATKGANSKSLRNQPFSDVMAMQRAYSLKPKLMNSILDEFFNLKGSEDKPMTKGIESFSA